MGTAPNAGGAAAPGGGEDFFPPPPVPKARRARTARPPAAKPASAAEQLRNQLEARLLEAAYFDRPLSTAAALTARSPGSDCFPVRHVRNSYEFLLQNPDDASRYVDSFEKSGIGLALVEAAAVGVEGAVATSPYGMLVDLCAAGYVNRIVACGRQAAITNPNAAAAAPQPKAKAPNRTGISTYGTAKLAPNTQLRQPPITLVPQEKADEV